MSRDTEWVLSPDWGAVFDLSPDTGTVWTGDEYISVVPREIPAYEGSVTVTPSETEQVLLTEGLMLNDNITVNPIPSNYGLITYSGSIITVS